MLIMKEKSQSLTRIYNLFLLNIALRISVVTYFDIQLNVSMEKGIVLLANLRAMKRSFNNPVSIFK